MDKFQNLWKYERNGLFNKKKKLLEFLNLKPRDPVILALCSQETFQKLLKKQKEGLKEKKAKIRAEKNFKKKKTIN